MTKISLLNARVGKPISTSSCKKKMDWFIGARHWKVQVWAQGWLSVAYLRLLSLNPTLLEIWQKAQVSFPGLPVRVCGLWVNGCHWHTSTPAQSFWQGATSSHPALSHLPDLELCGGVIPHRKAMVMVEMQRKQRVQAKNRRGPPHLLWSFL